MAPASTIDELLMRGGDEDSAIGAPGRRSLTYSQLRRLRDDVRGWLTGLGVAREDRVAIVLSNGPEMAAAFLTIAASASTAPLNPAYTRDEFAFYLSDLGAKLLVAESGVDSVAREVAKSLGVAIVELVIEDGASAGTFRLSGGGQIDVSAGVGEPPDPHNEALVLHTSGTTARPKIVPLMQRNLTASAANIAFTLRLTPDDVGLNIMPLFHVHGLVAGLLAPLLAGGTVICTPGFSALKFFTWLNDAKPTWYTGVPTMHQTILARSARHQGIIESSRLRFIRSSSASLPEVVMVELENQFGVPVIEAYGMTEAAHQMASNSLPPGARKSGSVGMAAGPEIAVMDEKGGLLQCGQPGEIVIRGENVFCGYAGNPEANACAFEDGWFRTGDLGTIDEDGFIRLTGRLKEIINRGGEKIAPREIDEVIQAHPAVAHAVTFALAHDKLGEDVAAAVVLKQGASVTEQELRDHAAQTLTDFKVPRKILICAEIPMGPTGKVQRIGLARRLGLT